MEPPTGPPRFDELVRSASGQLLASLIRYFGDFDVAEEALADAWLLAAERWPLEGFPDEPAAWVMTVARQTYRRHRMDSAEVGLEQLIAVEHKAIRRLVDVDGHEVTARSARL